MTETSVRIAAMADIHVRKTSGGALQSVFASINDCADVLVICGDLTDYGLTEEARILAKDLSAVHVPTVGVLGNHDFESSCQDQVAAILTDAGMTILDGGACEIRGVGFAGVKGFLGGFDGGTLGPWGESAVKAFVQEAINEALKLESALGRLRTHRRVALLHYAPIRKTVEGEPLEIFPYLGTARLEEPLRRYPVDVVFHGHAHHGSPEGRTSNGIPVYNVAMPLLRHMHPDRPPFRVVELKWGGAAGEVQG